MDSEAGGLTVTNWNHRQFREAALARYLTQAKDQAYIHSLLADFFLGTYGGGNPKAFRYTEVQRHRFGLKTKEAEADRQVPEMPLAFKSETGGKVASETVIFCHLTYPSDKVQPEKAR